MKGMQDHPVKEAPDYTNACLVMAFVNLFPWLVAVWAAFGYPAALVTGLCLHLVLNIWATRRR